MENIDLVWLQKQNIEWDDSLFGTKKGVIHSIEISDRGIRAYVMAFGQNTWLDLKDFNKTWKVR